MVSSAVLLGMGRGGDSPNRIRPNRDLPMRISSIFFLLVVALLASACESSGGRADTGAGARGDTPRLEESRSQGAGLWDMLDASRKEKENRLRLERAREGRMRDEVEKGMAQVPADQRDKMMLWWGEFLRGDPGWVQHRHDWRSFGPEAREILVENLLIAMVKAYEQNNGVVYRRARSELYELPTESTPYLVAGIAERMGDAAVRMHCVEMLGLIGRPALPAIGKTYRSRSPEIQIELLNAVKEMGPLGAPDSVAFLEKALDDADDYRVKLAAIQALGTSQDRRSIPVLVRCLRDDDVSVRKFAAGSLGYFKGTEPVPALIDALERAESRRAAGNREGEVADNCRNSLVILTGQRFRRASEWRRWWNAR